MATIDERLMLVDRDVTRRHKAKFTNEDITIVAPSGRIFIIKILKDDKVFWGRRTFMYFTDSEDGHTKLHKSQVSYWDTFKWINDTRARSGATQKRMTKRERIEILFNRIRIWTD